MSQAAETHPYEVLEHRDVFRGAIFSVVSEDVAMPDGGSAQRDVVRHPGSVSVVALEAHGRIALVRQYRHAVGRYLWELPAGLCDVADETPLQTAVRELAEEARLVAEQWHRLPDVYSSPGFCDELARVFLARSLTLVADPAPRRFEESELVTRWVSLDDAVAMVFRGELSSAVHAAAVLAAVHARAGGWALLEPA